MRRAARAPRPAAGRAARRPRGFTLLLTMLVLVLTTLFAARHAMQVALTRLADRAQCNELEAQWVAAGVARQWLDAARAASDRVDALLAPQTWRLNGLDVTVTPRSCESRLRVPEYPAKEWMPVWRQVGGDVRFVDNPDQKLVETAGAAIETILSPDELDTETAYFAPEDRLAPADLVTVWGNGKVDVNRASPDVLAVALKGFTDAQRSAILNARREGPIKMIPPLADRAGLTAAQYARLTEVAVTAPETLELLVRVRRGEFSVLYHVVLDVRDQGNLLELRLVQ